MEHLTSAALDQVLPRMGPALGAGSVTMISLEAIRERSGDRWSRKREQVAAFVERAFSRMASPGDLIVGLNEAEFVTVQPEATRAAALSLSAVLLKETLEFFLGAAAAEDMRLYRVTAFHDGELQVEAVDAPRVLSGADADTAPRQASEPDPHDSAAPPAEVVPAGRLSRARLIGGSGVELEVLVSTTPIWNVRGRVVSSFRLRSDAAVVRADERLRAPRPGEISSLLAGEIALRGIDYAVELMSAGASVGLHAPLSMAALSYSTSRYRLLRALRELDPAVRRLLVMELTEIEPGLPQSRLAELVAMLSPYCRAVLARAPTDAMDVRLWRRCGLNGVVLDCSQFDPGDRTTSQRLSAFAAAAEEVAPACLGYGVDTSSLLLTAWAAGFSHLSGAAICGPEAELPRGVRLQPEDLYDRRPAPEA